MWAGLSWSCGVTHVVICPAQRSFMTLRSGTAGRWILQCTSRKLRISPTHTHCLESKTIKAHPWELKFLPGGFLLSVLIIFPKWIPQKSLWALSWSPLFALSPYSTIRMLIKAFIVVGLFTSLTVSFSLDSGNLNNLCSWRNTRNNYHSKLK